MLKFSKKNIFYFLFIIVLVLAVFYLLSFVYSYIVGFRSDSNTSISVDTDYYQDYFINYDDPLMEKVEYITSVGRFGTWPLSVALSTNRGNPFVKKNNRNED